jgi:hypothetical protein
MESMSNLKTSKYQNLLTIDQKVYPFFVIDISFSGNGSTYPLIVADESLEDKLLSKKSQIYDKIDGKIFYYLETELLGCDIAKLKTVLPTVRKLICYRDLDKKTYTHEEFIETFCTRNLCKTLRQD